MFLCFRAAFGGSVCKGQDIEAELCNQQVIACLLWASVSQIKGCIYALTRGCSDICRLACFWSFFWFYLLLNSIYSFCVEV